LRLDRWFVRRERYDTSREAIETLNVLVSTLNVTIDRIDGEKDALEDDLEQANDKIAQLARVKQEVSQDEYNQAKTQQCIHCVLPGAYVAAPLPFPIERGGSIALGMDGEDHSVSKMVKHHHDGTVVSIRATGTLPLGLTGEHEVLLYPRLSDRRGTEGWKWRKAHAPTGERPVWKRADEVEVGDRLLFPIPSIVAAEAIPSRWGSLDAAWLLGLLVGDGHTSRRGDKRYHLGLTLSREGDVDRAVRTLLRMGTKAHRRDYPTYTRIIVSSRELAEEVATLIGTKSTQKHLPVFAWSRLDYLEAAVEGLMAADGTHLERGTRGVVDRLFTTSLVLAWQTWQAALMLGRKPFIYSVRRKSGFPNASPAWTVSWSSSPQRKPETVIEGGLYVMPVREISRSHYTGPVYDLSVNEGHTFAVNGILTHNCGGVHSISCPRVKRIRFRGDGQTPLEVEYFESWPQDNILWIEDLYVPKIIPS
jgi:hypothetical protein